MCKVCKYKQAGFTLIELLISVVLSAVIMAATYTSYTIVSKQSERVSAYAEVQESGIPAIQLISRDLRMAGHKSVDANIESSFGSISNPVLITDSGNACCDSVEIIYDVDLSTRYRVTYYVAARTNPTRNALYMDKESWDGISWTAITTQSLVADYIEDFQLLGSDINSSGDPALIDISMIFRSKKLQVRGVSTYTKPSYNIGNYNFTTTDAYYHDSFSATINLRNLRNVVY
jgi:prepilin-type N-terminal cleavage/methylation domain-containing protein